MEANKKTLIIGGSILVVTIGLFFVARAIVNKIKKDKEELDKGLLDEDLKPKPIANEVADAVNYNPTSDVKAIGGYIVGYNANYYPKEVNSIIAKLTDSRLKKLATAYKTKYKVSLYENLNGEWVWGWGDTYEPSIKRLLALGLK